MADFKRGWGRIAESDEERSAILRPLYATELKDELFFVAGEEPYHVYHKKWHTVYRKQLSERNYYDIYMFDLKGNAIYSVHKERSFR